MVRYAQYHSVAEGLSLDVTVMLIFDNLEDQRVLEKYPFNDKNLFGARVHQCP